MSGSYETEEEEDIDEYEDDEREKFNHAGDGTTIYE